MASLRMVSEPSRKIGLKQSLQGSGHGKRSSCTIHPAVRSDGLLEEVEDTCCFIIWCQHERDMLEATLALDL